MNKVLATAVAAGLAVTISACGSTANVGPVPARYAAVVNGKVIPQADVFEQLSVYAKNPGLLGGAGLQIEGETPGTYSGVATAGVLQIEIVQSALLQELASSLGVKTSADDEKAARAEITQTWASAQVPVASLPKSFVEHAVRQQALITAVSSRLAESAVSSEDLAKVVAANPEIKKQYDLRVIAAADQAKADAVRAQLDGGTPFDQLARTANGDPQLAQNGGQVPPLNGVALAKAIPEVAAAVQGLQPGQASKVIAVTQRGRQVYYLVKLEKVGVADDAQVRGIALRLLNVDPRQLLSDRLRKLTASASVRVNPRLGQWVQRPDEGATVVPPAAPLRNGEEELKPRVPAAGDDMSGLLGPGGGAVPGGDGGAAGGPGGPAGGAPAGAGAGN